MPEIVLGADVPHLLVILQSDATNVFAITVQVEPADLIGVEAVLDFGEISHEAVLDSTKYTWTLNADDVAELSTRDPAILSLVSLTGRTLLGRGIVEIRT